MMPLRIQLSRRRGWRMPANTVKCDRATKWGNPIVPGKRAFGLMVADKRHAAALYFGFAPQQEALVVAARAELVGKNLGCWCHLCDLHRDGKPLGESCPYCEPCHVDTWARSPMARRKRRQPARPPTPRGFECWQPVRYEIAAVYSDPPVEVVDGLEFRGLGLHLHSATKARYRRKDKTRRIYWSWALTHLNTGHLVRGFYDVAINDVFAAATDLALISDWTFDGLDGWRNTDPDLPDKLQQWHARFKLGARQAGQGGNDDVARAIGMKRW